MLALFYVHGEDAEAVDGELRDVEEAVGGEAAQEAASVAVLLRQLRAGQTAGRGVAVAVHHAALALPGQAQARTLQIMVFITLQFKIFLAFTYFPNKLVFCVLILRFDGTILHFFCMFYRHFPW